MRYTAIAIASLGLVMLTAPYAVSQPPAHAGKGNKGGHHAEQQVWHAPATNNYHCPPGLANKGCMPPGQAKKRYQVGYALPDNVVYYPVPIRYRDRLEPLPRGYVYGQVDGDILLIAEATRKVMDAVITVNAAVNALED